MALTTRSFVSHFPRHHERGKHYMKRTTVLNRREFSRFCLSASGYAMTAGSAAFGQSNNAAPNGARSVKLRDGRSVSALGQGSARLAHGRHSQADEEAALRTGIDLGMTLIDTAELYGSEELIGRVIAGQRERVFLVSKVWPSHMAGDGIARACAASLKRLGTDHLDLYLLHWPNGVSDFAHVVKAFEDLRAAGKIRAWGVSNFKVSDMEKLFRVPQGERCAMNQVPYSLDDRGMNAIFWHGANGTTWRSWPTRRLAAPAPHSLAIRRWRASARHITARRPRWRWPGPSAAAASLRFRNPARRRM